jgi:acyl-CoA reductase-like NAD-dependent aldehyde dehydrogenase
MSTATLESQGRDELIACNPATGAELGRVVATPTSDVAHMVARARQAQRHWGALPWRDRRAFLERLWRILARDTEAWVEAIRDEIGKPRVEALTEVMTTHDSLRWTVRATGKVLADRRMPPGWWQRFLMLPAQRLRWRPYGVVGMVGTWNFPLLLNALPIAQALAAGNAVVWKPSELAPLSGLRLQRNLQEADFPEGLISAVFGGPEIGAALIGAALDKGHFTGGIETGRRVLADLARRGIPAVAELSGFDPAVILPDAPREASVRALTWGAFVNSGQTCVAVKRIYVVGDAVPWADALIEHARALRVGDPALARVDMGPLISETARERFHQMIEQTIAAGACLLTGGAPGLGPGWFYPPTVLLAESPEPESKLAGAFGPVVLVREVPDVEAAIRAANSGIFGLAASVWGRDRAAARAVAQRLDAGMVAINDAVTPSAHASAPFGGVKGSGYGRTRGPLGLLEFVQSQTLHDRSPGGFRPQLFPYTLSMERILGVYRRLFHS